MRKFLAVVKHEYKKIVLKWTFLIGTLLFPLIAAMFAVVPAIIFSIKGEPIRIAIVDPVGKLGPRIRENLGTAKLEDRAKVAAKDAGTDLNLPQDEKTTPDTMMLDNGYVFQDYNAGTKTVDEIRADLLKQIVENRLDAYVLVPPNFESKEAVFEFRSRKTGGFVGNSILRNAINDAVRSHRLSEAKISESLLRDINLKVNLDVKKVDEKGDEKDGDAAFAAAFIIGMMIYITLAIYGQLIMGAVVEEKETRVAEILFSSARPFELMMGKLVGVGMAGLTQLAIWVLSALVLAGVGVSQMNAAGMPLEIPNITPLMIIYFFIFFLLGFFIYASIFALIGSMVTTVQEGGQFAFPPIMILLIGFYFSFAVIGDPNSNLSFWVSIAPFFAPITMPVRILAEMPPFWQIALSVLINGLAIAGLVWLASRVYRVGMLMYGKRATIPEVWKWIRQR